MGFWKQLFGQSSSSAEIDHRRSGEFASWVEPHVPPATEEWERRLRNYAKKCAHELESARVPKWRSRFPRDSVDSYSHAFWIISVDAEAAERYLVEFRLTSSAVIKANEFGGFIRGYALLLTASGGLFSAATEMWFPESGDHEEGNLDSLFHDPSSNLLRSSPWAGLNVGRWRRQPDKKVYGATQSTMCSEFKSRYPPHAFSGKDPGKGSSIALNRFVKSHGRTQWPRYFDQYYGD